MTEEIEIQPTEQQLKDLDKFLKKKTKFILDENKNVIPATLLEWGAWLEDKNNRKHKIVKQEEVNGLEVSTVFIGLDHGHPVFCTDIRNYKPLIFETMIFKDQDEVGYCDRYSTWQEAEEGHAKAVQWVKDGCVEEDDHDN